MSIIIDINSDKTILDHLVKAFENKYDLIESKVNIVF